MQKDAEHPITFASTKGNPDTLYLHEAMQADGLAFKVAMIQEANDHMVAREHWEVWERQDVPEEQTLSHLSGPLVARGILARSKSTSGKHGSTSMMVESKRMESPTRILMPHSSTGSPSIST
jgi:hypothetical protein